MPWIGFWPALTEHLALSAIPAGVGVILAWPVSSAIARFARRLQPFRQSTRLLRSFLPWRAALVTLLVICLPLLPALLFIRWNPLLFFFTGVSLASFLMALAVLTLARSQTTTASTETARILSAIRTHAVVMVGLAIPGYSMFSHGAAPLISQGQEGLEFAWLWTGVAAVAAAALLIDLLLGALEYAYRIRSDKDSAAP